jgi:hypothetical protein
VKTDATELFSAIIARLAFIATVLLFLLKLTRWIDISWWLVPLPIYIVLALVVALFILGLLLGVVGGLWDLVTGQSRKPMPRYDTSHIEPLDSIKNPRKS